MTKINTLTPCIGVCSTSIGDRVCRGCKRFAHEIIDWNGYEGAQRGLVNQRREALLEQVMADKLSVVDEALLTRQMAARQVRHHPGIPPLCRVFELLRAGAGQIRNLTDYGVVLLPGWERYDLVGLREQIDREFYALSCAHYDRYIVPGAQAGDLAADRQA